MKAPLFPVAALMAALALGACAQAPLTPYTTDMPPLVLVPASQAGVRDMRGRFREIFCQILEARGDALADNRPCEEALTRLGKEPPGTGEPVDLGPARRRLVLGFVPGLGADCLRHFIGARGEAIEHVRQFGYDVIFIGVEGLSSSESNARQIRDAIMRIDLEGEEPRLVLNGYSKGAVDILEAIVSYPEIRPKIAAFVSTSGAIGGSPLANSADPSDLNLLRSMPGADCPPGDGGAIESMRPAIRMAWLANNDLPDDIPYYSLATFPRQERISSALMLTYDKLSKVDPRNDSQLLFYDQVIPKSTLLGYLNADHWAIVLPIARSNPVIGATVLEHNDFPREALLEAVMRFLEWDLAGSEN